MGTVAESLRALLPERVDFTAARLSRHEEAPVTVVSDLHLPYLDEDLFESMLERSQQIGAKSLYIVGDLFNMAPYSRHGAGLGTKQEVLRRCRDLAHRTLEIAFSTFGTIVVSPGNHDEWMIKHNEGHFGMYDMLRWVWPEGGEYLDGVGTCQQGGQPKSLVVSELPTVEVTVKGTRWLLEHPGSYSSVRTRVAQNTADKYQCNVAVGHVHHWGLTTDRSGRYLAVELGGLFKPEYFDYVHQKPRPLPGMTSGYAILDGEHALMFRG